MYENKTEYEKWEQNALEKIRENGFVAFCLHDCYANLWLPHYREFLKKISELGRLKTIDDVANDIILGSGENAKFQD